MSQDPLGFEAGDSNLYRYVNNAPTDTTDPSGEIVVTTLTPNPTISAKGWRVKWKFELSKEASEDGYIVQKVIRTLKVDGKDAPEAETRVFWEAWFVKKGQKLDTDFGAAPNDYTDNSARGNLPGTCGKYTVTGEIKFFFKSVTGNLGDPGANPKVAPDPATGWKSNNPIRRLAIFLHPRPSRNGGMAPQVSGNLWAQEV